MCYSIREKDHISEKISVNEYKIPNFNTKDVDFLSIVALISDWKFVQNITKKNRMEIMTLERMEEIISETVQSTEREHKGNQYEWEREEDDTSWTFSFIDWFRHSAWLKWQHMKRQ